MDGSLIICGSRGRTRQIVETSTVSFNYRRYAITCTNYIAGLPYAVEVYILAQGDLLMDVLYIQIHKNLLARFELLLGRLGIFPRNHSFIHHGPQSSLYYNCLSLIADPIHYHQQYHNPDSPLALSRAPSVRVEDSRLQP